MVRPWHAALGLTGCGLIWLLAFAWSVQFEPAAILSGVGRAAAVIRFEALAMTAHMEAAELTRARVRSLRDEGAAAAALQRKRFDLANELRDAGLLAHADGNAALAEELLTAALQAAPERADLRCLLVDVRTRALPADERRVALLELVHESGSACAHALAGESFLQAGDMEAAQSYLARAAELRPDWVAPHLLLAEVAWRRGDRAGALASAGAALEHAQSLRDRLAAVERVRMAGGRAPERWRVIGEHARREWWPVGALAAAFVLFLVHPALVRAARRGLARLRSQPAAADSTS